MRDLKEINVITKSTANTRLRIGLIYPNTYQVGMSGLTIKLLYHLLNQHINITTERIFYSAKPDFPSLSLESKRPLHKFDILMFTVQFELDIINVIKMLEQAHIPVYAKNRGNDSPLLVAGGPVITANPPLLSQIFDSLFIGEFESVSSEYLEGLIQSKVSGLKDSVLSIKGFQNPLDMPVDPKPLITDNLDSVDYPLAQVRPVGDIRKIKNALNGYFLQISRGCPHGCHFCLISQIFRPHRERSLETLQRIIISGTNASQTNFINLIGSSTADYSRLQDLLSFMLDRNYKFTLPSIRVDSAFPLLNIIKETGQKSLTIAPETGDDDLRRRIGKKISNTEILDFIKESLNFGIKQFKLYFILGLSEAPNAEMASITELIRNISKIGKEVSLNASITPFVPKKNTRMRNACPDYNIMDLFHSRINEVRSKHIQIKIFPPKWAEIQAILSLGNSDLTSKLIQVARERGSYQSWKKTFNNDPSSFFREMIC